MQFINTQSGLILPTAATVVEKKSEFPAGTTVIRVLASCRGRDFRKSHQELSSGQVLVTVQKIIGGDAIRSTDDSGEVYDIPAEYLPPHAAPGAYLNLPIGILTMVETMISQDMYLGRSIEGSEPNRSMVFDVVISSNPDDITINTAGKFTFRGMEAGNWAKNSGIRQSRDEALSALREATEQSSNIRKANLNSLSERRRNRQAEQNNKAADGAEGMDTIAQLDALAAL